MENKSFDGGSNTNLKFCKYCGEKIHMEAVICTKCGRQVEELKGPAQPNVIINNDNSNRNTNANVNANINTNGYMGRPRNKITALLLCILLGWLGAHKFYEGRVVMGIIYLCTVGLFGIGIIIDFIALLFKPSIYYI